MPQVGSGILRIIPSLDSRWAPGRQSRRSCCCHPFASGPHPGHRACPLARNPSESTAAKAARPAHASVGSMLKFAGDSEARAGLPRGPGKHLTEFDSS